MTTTDLPISEPTTTKPPTTSAALGTWTMADQVGAEQWAAMRVIAGLTVDTSVIDRLDANQE